MYRNLTFAMAASLATILFVSSCEHLEMPTEAQSPTMEKKDITFSLQTKDFNISKSTRATLAEGNITDVLIIDRIGTTIQQTIAKASSDDDFASPTLSLAFGTHELTFIAHRSEAPTFDPEAFSWTADKIRDTYIYQQSLTVNAETSTAQAVTLGRQVYQLKFLVNDALPTNLTTVRISVNDYYPTLSLATLNASGSTTLTRDIAVPSSVLGTTGNYFSVYGFCPTNGTEYATDATITFLTSSNTPIVSYPLTNVPLETNCITTVSGNFFELNPTTTLSINTTWGTPKNINL